MLQFMGSPRVGHDLATEQQQKYVGEFVQVTQFLSLVGIELVPSSLNSPALGLLLLLGSSD